MSGGRKGEGEVRLEGGGEEDERGEDKDYLT